MRLAWRHKVNLVCENCSNYHAKVIQPNLQKLQERTPVKDNLKAALRDRKCNLVGDSCGFGVAFDTGAVVLVGLLACLIHLQLKVGHTLAQTRHLGVCTPPHGTQLILQLIDLHLLLTWLEIEQRCAITVDYNSAPRRAAISHSNNRTVHIQPMCSVVSCSVAAKMMTIANLCAVQSPS